MILIISSPRDLHAQAVMKAFAKQGRSDVRIVDLSEFPMHMDIGISMSNGADSSFALRFRDGKRVDMADVTAVWWRRPQPFGLPAEMKDPVHRQFAMQESDLAFRGMWQCSEALWVNDVNRDAAASHKPWQLHVAKELGLAIPRTLITNSPDDARRFCQQSGDVIYKAFLASALAWRETRRIRAEEIRMLDMVRTAPVIFQSFVPAVRDLRVTIVGERLFPAAADASAGEYAADVRMNPGIRWEKHPLPPTVEKQLLALMRRLGLEYGAIDLRLTPEGEYVFLEINPAGQFLFIEQATGMPIAMALASHLASATTHCKADDCPEQAIAV